MIKKNKKLIGQNFLQVGISHIIKIQFQGHKAQMKTLLLDIDLGHFDKKFKNQIHRLNNLSKNNA